MVSKVDDVVRAEGDAVRIARWALLQILNDFFDDYDGCWSEVEDQMCCDQYSDVSEYCTNCLGVAILDSLRDQPAPRLTIVRDVTPE